MARSRKYKCPYCGSTETHWKGYRKIVCGLRRIRKCRRCLRRFTTGMVLKG